MAKDKKDKEKVPLKKQIALLSFRIAARYLLSDKEDRQNLMYAQTLLNQAMMLSEDDESNARKLMNSARRVSRKK